MGPKSKDQILQKWDPVSRTLVNIYIHPPPEPAAVVPAAITSAVLDGNSAELTINWTVTQALSVTLYLYDGYDSIVEFIDISGGTTSYRFSAGSYTGIYYVDIEGPPGVALLRSNALVLP
jgi:hypothetical protein